MSKSSAKGQSGLDLSIPGDELEHDRIQLEHNLQHTDLSFHLSSVPEDDVYHNPDHDSIEFPRHNSGPTHLPEFPSFEHQSQGHGWSYRTVDDEEGINPYGGETISTAAHHASGLTLSAGLGGRAARRDVSISGAEYDPERPLQDMIAGVDSRFSAFDVDPSKSRYAGAGSVAFDPVVVDSTAELDRILQSGYSIAPNVVDRSRNFRSTHSSSSSASDSDTSSGRPKLSDALRRVSFSPKRPRSPQSHRSHTYQPKQSQLSRNNDDDQDASHLDLNDYDLLKPPALPSHSQSRRVSTPIPLTTHHSADNAVTPKQPRSKRNIFPSYGSSQPEVRLQPPTPSTAGSQFTKMAKSITREIDAEQSRPGASVARPVSAGGVSSTTHLPKAQERAQERNPFHDLGNNPDASGVCTSRQYRGHTPRGKSHIHLPDVTGLTSAVESPARPGLGYYPYNGDDRPRESEARLLSTLSAVQMQLHHLEEENSISRRRVRELELELEVCKREVARERTRVIEREESIIQQQQRERPGPSRKGKGKATEERNDDQATERYREIVEEKKALEALIMSLRSHLTRLTLELSSHQELLTELRSLRDSDARALREKSLEIDMLRKEVERLAGEVEVLRGVVEEGLKERRLFREQSHAEEAEEASDQEHNQAEPERMEETDEEEGHETESQQSEDDGSFDAQSHSILDSFDNNDHPPDKTARTDHATLGSSAAINVFVGSQELGHVSEELGERRSIRSSSVLDQSHSQHLQSNEFPRSVSPHPFLTVPGGNVDASNNYSRSNNTRQEDRAPSPVRPPARPPAPTPAHASARDRRVQTTPPAPETPFPQIRGGRLERLFFSAPEHNARTCTICHRRRRAGSVLDEPSSLSWLPPRRHHDFRATVEDASDDDDEGFVEGSDNIEPIAHAAKGKQREHRWMKDIPRDCLPPQTVLSRVLREIEDDFTHYKSIYVELADQYKDMDAVSNVPKRNMLARHLREVVDILEQKGDQIASLYDLLTFEDKPLPDPPTYKKAPQATASFSGKSRPLQRHNTYT